MLLRLETRGGCGELEAEDEVLRAGDRRQVWSSDDERWSDRGLVGMGAGEDIVSEVVILVDGVQGAQVIVARTSVVSKLIFYAEPIARISRCEDRVIKF